VVARDGEIRLGSQQRPNPYSSVTPFYRAARPAGARLAPAVRQTPERPKQRHNEASGCPAPRTLPKAAPNYRRTGAGGTGGGDSAAAGAGTAAGRPADSSSAAAIAHPRVEGWAASSATITAGKNQTM
jgi:hypothetical protein